MLLPSHPRSLLRTCCLAVGCGGALSLHAQLTFPGTLDTKLHVDAADLGLATFSLASGHAAAELGIALQPGDKLYTGTFDLPRSRDQHGALHYKAAILRSASHTDTLFLATASDAPIDSTHPLPFHPLSPPQPRLASGVSIEVTLPAGSPFAVCPLEIRLPAAGARTPARSGELAIRYTSFALVSGEAQLPGRPLRMQFQYDFTRHTVDLAHAIEFADLDGDGVFDRTPGNPEMDIGRGSAPVFELQGQNLQVESIDLDHNTFSLREVAPPGVARINLKVGATLPDFTYADFNGTPHRLSNLKTRYLLLDFWATWCVPCIQNLPFQRAAYSRFHSQGFDILGINGDDSPAKPRRVIAESAIAWPQARFDKTLVQDRFGITAWPTTILIDSHRRIVSLGAPGQLPLDYGNLDKTLATLFQ